MRPLEEGEPTTVGPYRLLGRLGSGGMGRVYLGRSTGGRTVAVKVVHPHFAQDEQFRARFHREVDAARRVGGAWTAPVLDADPEAPVPWVATGYAAGPTLAAAVTDGAALPEQSVRVLGAGLAEALTAVHGLGLVHRDVKPSNVLLTLDGPLLIDFGIARAMDSAASLTSTGVSVGSPGYMSPEQILGEGATGAADVFSLGAVLAYAALGKPPFPGDTSAALLYKVVHTEPELGALRGELRELVGACLAKSPAARPAPEEVAGRLAPRGTARLVSAGWLPGRLVEQLSRSAVQLLNLEAGQAEPSGPVGFSRVSEAGPSAVPELSAAPQPSSGPAPATDRAAVDKLSVSLAATSDPGAAGRGRRVSCTVALAIAGALAVTVGAGLVPGLGLFGKGGAGGAGDASRVPRSPAATAEGTAPSAVPGRYLGTWEGDATALGGTLPMGTFRVTIHQAAAGEEFGTLRQTDQLGGDCDDVLVLKKATRAQLYVTSVAEAGNRDVCTKGRHLVRLTPTGTDLRLQMNNTEAGNPVARLTRVG
ncbi:serine/threonine-protein kinase [Streptomyces sp. NPDC048664]|uniref:serine/threonine-protein kinase n=1 Tax=Streptomyces sp. NPDC048664 TaxID=3154505 RepID=UPI00343E660B